ncbi:hypothetical protein AERO8C_80106 [Aeromonas veronii]|uniref:Uncharacterized protein n=1 Tax=Aeromonas veronii TaxID=654 RepID=A0A653LED9_AERVE|nr:hypothetical protein AERO8C_80106 [Aeromonas veronii]
MRTVESATQLIMQGAPPSWMAGPSLLAGWIALFQVGNLVLAMVFTPIVGSPHPNPLPKGEGISTCHSVAEAVTLSYHAIPRALSMAAISAPFSHSLP